MEPPIFGAAAAPWKRRRQVDAAAFILRGVEERSPLEEPNESADEEQAEK
jgi:hypothetical protein